MESRKLFADFFANFIKNVGQIRRNEKSRVIANAALRRIRLRAPILNSTANDQIPLSANAVVGSPPFSLFCLAFSANAI